MTRSAPGWPTCGLVAVMLVGLAGCPMRSPPAEPPLFALERLGVIARTPAGFRLRADFTVASRAGRGLTLDALDWAVSLDDGAPRRGRTHLGQMLDARAVRALAIELESDDPDAGEVRRFALSATLHARGPDGPVAVVVDEVGELESPTSSVPSRSPTPSP